MTPPTFWLTTLGCAKNQVDSEKVQAMLAEAGYQAADSPGVADVVMVNTCAFIEDARRESVEAILNLQEEKRPDARTVVLGCMAQRFGVEVEQALPEVDSVLGLDRYGELVSTLDRLTGQDPAGPDTWRPLSLRRPVMDILYAVKRPQPTLPYAYVKVAEGCDKPCTFCAIPMIRGKQRSRRPVNIAQEVAGLVEAGVTEVVLVAQDLAAYGRDIDAPGGLVELIDLLDDIDGLVRLRLLYLYPKEIRPGLIDQIAYNPKVASYFDLSLQHASEQLLRAMKRPGGTDRYLDLIRQIREADPDAALRSSFIVGFPGESDDQVEELADFLAEARLDWAGFFPYSAEEGTPAALLGGRVPSEVVSERHRYLQGIQDEITSEAGAAMIGRRLEVLVDQVEDGVAVARSYREAPEIDGVITIDAGSPGDWLEIEVTASFGSELAGKKV
ncbi:MAG TPA: 30S ribosomal protein S12 methylthiotransferase RimO [Acidimicrobiia bacterium]|nr:30S ribosomal protein S12 methylthiotransferase RimO [Acidimicrobiia bacterium]